MRLYLDHHKNLEGLTAQAVALRTTRRISRSRPSTERRLLGTGSQRGEGRGLVCLFEAPNAEAAEAVHREAHGGNVADEIIEVKEGS